MTACSNTAVSSRNIDINEDNDRLNELAGDSPELLNSPSLPTDPVSIGQMESLSVACPSDLSTFFSPNFEYDDSLFKIMNHNSAETLVHSSLEHSLDADFTFQLSFDMKQHTVYVRRRPYLQMFLERVAQLFEVVIFTASQSIYAEQLLDILDPERNLISQRMFRESCIFSDGGYTKDLTILGVDLAKVAIIDNTPQVFRLQVNNGIPIKSWFDDPTDSALLSLLPFLETLIDADDVRPIIAKKYSN